MLILYTKEGCKYCAKVKKAFAERSVVYEERSISNPEYLKEVQSYNSRSVPFLVDTVANIAMPESDDIIDYASEHAF